VLNSADIGNISNGPEQIGALTYQDSVGFTCYTEGNLANFASADLRLSVRVRSR
jgi:hypothetical protein